MGVCLLVFWLFYSVFLLPLNCFFSTPLLTSVKYNLLTVLLSCYIQKSSTHITTASLEPMLLAWLTTSNTYILYT